jgi:hypothetical protein|tara:strand:+ start:302 stop:868 length:567 start_codon:yes stop_codon:yes gene_type:complete
MGLLDKAYEQSKLNTIDSSQITDVGEACNELDMVRQAISDKEAEIKKMKDREFQLENEVIPSFFENAGVSSLTLTDGSKVVIRDQLRSNITEENKDFCWNWLDQNNLSDVIKNDVVLTFGRGQDSEARDLMVELEGKGLHPANKKQVPWNTLAKLVEEQIQKGSMTSDVQDKFGVHTYKKVKIERKVK